MRLAVLALSLCLGSQAMAQPTAPACAAPEHRQFDFWIGDWEVVALKTGKLAGHNSIRRETTGCVLHENYTTPGGYQGQSLNIYDAARKVWHQTWVDNGGLLLVIEGGWRGDRMVMQGATTGADGKRTLNRISWIPNADGTVRQHWEQSKDAGKAWATAFDGLYRRLASGSGGEGKPSVQPRTVI